MEYIYSAMLLHVAGKKITDENLRKDLMMNKHTIEKHCHRIGKQKKK